METENEKELKVDEMLNTINGMLIELKVMKNMIEFLTHKEKKTNHTQLLSIEEKKKYMREYYIKNKEVIKVKNNITGKKRYAMKKQQKILQEEKEKQ